MRYIYIFICLGMLIMGGAQARSLVSGSEIEKPLFSLDVRKMPLEQVLDEISERSGYDIVLRGEAGEENLPISLKLEDVTLDEMLRRVLRELNHTALWDEAEKKILLSAYASKNASKKDMSQDAAGISAQGSGEDKRPQRGSALNMAGFGRPATLPERTPSVSVSGNKTRFAQTTDTTD
jgi:hypothetical protein